MFPPSSRDADIACARARGMPASADSWFSVPWDDCPCGRAARVVRQECSGGKLFCFEGEVIVFLRSAD